MGVHNGVPYVVELDTQLSLSPPSIDVRPAHDHHKWDHDCDKEFTTTGQV